MLDDSIVNVLDYGALGDGATDDTAAVNAALDAGLTVYFPPRRYIIAGNINRLRSGHVLYGPSGYTSGAGGVSLTGGAKLLVTSASGAVFSALTPATPINGLNISNITMHVAGAPSWVIDLPTVTGLHLSKLSVWVVDGVTTAGCLRTRKILPGDNSWATTMHEVHCRIPDAAVVRVLNIDTSDSEIMGCSFVGGMGSRLRGTGNVKAIGNRFDRSNASGAGLEIAKATESKTAHLIIGNQFDANNAAGLLINGDYNDALLDTNCCPSIVGNQFRTLGAGTADIRFKNLTGPVLNGGIIMGNTHTSASAARCEWDPIRWTGIEMFPCAM